MARIIEDTELFNEIMAAIKTGGLDAAWDCLFDQDDDGAPICKTDYRGPFISAYFNLETISSVDEEYVCFYDQSTVGYGDGSFKIIPAKQ